MYSHVVAKGSLLRNIKNMADRFLDVIADNVKKERKEKKKRRRRKRKKKKKKGGGGGRGCCDNKCVPSVQQ